MSVGCWRSEPPPSALLSDLRLELELQPAPAHGTGPTYGRDRACSTTTSCPFGRTDTLYWLESRALPGCHHCGSWFLAPAECRTWFYQPQRWSTGTSESTPYSLISCIYATITRYLGFVYCLEICRSQHPLRAQASILRSSIGLGGCPHLEASALRGQERPAPKR
ncbi:hypothetical protein GY45DRAFT_91579 [Cubamyces sp. BRFM 1775]|nr:hypothetical protein GY45DRAFT_91579 [Cubamyces sp. BRFM 1775]